MKVILEVGPRNEELIEKICEAKKNGNDIWSIAEPSSEMFDALYYACECGNMMLEDQARYLQWLLIEEEYEHVVIFQFHLFIPPYGGGGHQPTLPRIRFTAFSALPEALTMNSLSSFNTLSQFWI